MKRKIQTITTLIIAAITLCGTPLKVQAATRQVYWTDSHSQVYYSINAKTSDVVKIALQLFAHDMQVVTGHAAKEKVNAPLQIFQIDQLNNKEFAALEKLNLPIHRFITKKDAFYICTRSGRVIVVGSDARGTAYGILELSRMAGVSPWNDWNGGKPHRQNSLGTKTGYESLQIPDTEYRGLVLNASRWMSNRNASSIARLMLRLRANTLWQEGTHHEVIYDKAVTDSFDLIIGSGHKLQEVQGKKHKKHRHSINDIKTLWSNPQLWLRTSAPGLILNEMDEKHEAYIANVYDPQSAAYQLQLVMDLAWNHQSVTPTTLTHHLQTWLSNQLGNDLGKQLLPIMKEYYRLTSIRQPEYMIMPFGNMEFHSGEFGNELERYLYAYDQLKEKVKKIERSIPKESNDVFFQLVKYPIFSAALVAEKELEAQEARHIARPGLFDKDDEAKAAAALSLHAYQQLKVLVQHYCNIGKGKWRNIIDPNDGALQMPQLPGRLNNEEVSLYKKDAFNRSSDLKPLRAMSNEIIAKNAYEWKNTSGERPTTLIPLIGHSNQCVLLPKKSTLHYSFSILKGGDARFTLASLPDYVGNKGNQQVSIRIDQNEPVIISLHDAYNSSAWKSAIWRGQTLKSIFVTLDKGDHTIEITALDDSVILDQWVLDFDVDREYYVIPTVNKK